jgi:hypothetical protein
MSIDLNEAQVLRKVDEQADSYLKKYPEQIKILEGSTLNTIRPHGIDQQDVWALGKTLEQMEWTIKLFEEAGSIADLGAYPIIALDSLAVLYGESPINAFAAVQPIEEKLGNVYFQQFIAQNTRGNVSAGQTLFDTLATPQAFPNGYMSDTSTVTVISESSPGSGVFSDVSLSGGQDFSSPIDPRTINFTGSVVCSAGTATFSVTPDSTTGLFGFSVQEGSSATYLNGHGSVDYANGTFSLTLSETPSGQTTVIANFQVLEEANVDLQSAQLVWQNKPIQAQLFALKSLIGIPQEFMLKKRFSISLAEEVAKSLVAAINNEIVNRAIAILLQYTPTTSPTQITYPVASPSGTTFFEYQMTIQTAFDATDAQMVARAGRGSVNCWIVGRRAGIYIKRLPNFKHISNGDGKFGAHIYGTLDGVPVVRVPYQAVLDELTVLGVYRGDNFTAPLVYAPYMPLITTEVLQVLPNPLQRQRASAIMAGLDSLIPNLSVSFVFDDSGSPF